MVKNIVAYSFLFLLLYFENLNVGFVKLSHLWKVVLFGYLLIIIFKFKLPLRLQKFVLLGFVVSFSIFFHSNSFKNIAGDITFFLDLVSIPIFVSFFSICLVYKTQLNLEKFVLNVSIFILISNIPFLLGILESKQAALGLYSGVVEQAKVFGIFNNASGASKVFTLSSLIVFAHKNDFFNNGYFRKVVWVSLCIVGFFSVVYSFTRTGWALYVMGLLILTFYKSSNKMRLIAFLLAILLIPALIVFFETNQTLYNRLIGKKENKEYVTGDYNRISSGRVDLYKYSIEIFTDLSPPEKILGIGTHGALEEMNKKTGNRTYSHNRILEILLVGGLFTLFLYLLFIKYLIGIAKIKFQNSTELKARLSMTLLILFLISLIPSHGFGFYSNILFSAVIVLNQIDNKYESKIRISK